MAKRYTHRKLTDAMLRRLSQAVNGRNPGGTSTQALERKDLVRVTRPTLCRHALGLGRRTWVGEYRVEATVAGRLALAQARGEGW